MEAIDKLKSQKTINPSVNNSVKTLLYAFLQKNYEVLELKREIEKLSNELEDRLDRLF